ncbi:MAG TPA: GntR family transcriptional regulator [Planctomycetaceae bacterium]|nr:GntR family transcriptional regulator [Planctomycetaceae bacterium]
MCLEDWGFKLQIDLSSDDGRPIYRQIVSQIKYNIAAGVLSPGDELPGIRPLAEQLLVTPNTIVKAYGKLEVEGVIVKRHGAGTFVSEQAASIRKAERDRLVAERVDALLSEAKLLGIDFESLINVIERRAKQVYPSK